MLKDGLKCYMEARPSEDIETRTDADLLTIRRAPFFRFCLQRAAKVFSGNVNISLLTATGCVKLFRQIEFNEKPGRDKESPYRNARVTYVAQDVACQRGVRSNQGEEHV